MYEVIFTSAAERYIKKMKEKPLKEAFRKAILLIAEDPYVGNPKRGDLSGIYGYDLYYAKTNYEIAYVIVENKKKKVIVVLAGTRENFYQQLKHYLDKGNTKLIN